MSTGFLKFFVLIFRVGAGDRDDESTAYPQLSVAGIGMKIYQNLGRFSSLLTSTASLKMKSLKAQVDFTRFHPYFQN